MPPKHAKTVQEAEGVHAGEVMSTRYLFHTTMMYSYTFFSVSGNFTWHFQHRLHDAEVPLEQLHVIFIDKNMNIRSVSASKFKRLLQRYGTMYLSQSHGSMPAECIVSSSGEKRLRLLDTLMGIDNESSFVFDIPGYDTEIPVISHEDVDENGLAIISLDPDSKRWRFHNVMTGSPQPRPPYTDEEALTVCQNAFEKMSNKCVANVIVNVVDTCVNAFLKFNHFHTGETYEESPWYHGVFPHVVPRGVFDMWRCVSGYDTRFQNVNAFGQPEFITNMVKTPAGDIYLMCNKFIGVEYNVNVEVWHQSVLCNADPSPGIDAVDFVWNVLFLKLASEEKIKQFVATAVSEDTYLLGRGDMMHLVRDGVHSEFDADFQSAREVYTKIQKFIQDF
jgi:hypothetical protein